MESNRSAAVERMIPGLPREEVIEALYILNRQGETSQRKLAFYLLDFQKRKLFRPEARDAVQWARKHLELKDARRLLRLAERLAELPLLDGAFARGEIGWTKCREVSRVATADIDAVWTEYARTHNSREVEAATSGRQRGQRPGEGGPRARRTRLQVQLGLDAEGEATWEAAVRKVREELGPGSTPSDVLVALSKRALEGEPETPDSKRRRRDPATTVVFHCAPEKAEAWLDTRRGPVEVAPEVIHRKVQEGVSSSLAVIRRCRECQGRRAQGANAMAISELSRSVSNEEIGGPGAPRRAGRFSRRHSLQGPAPSKAVDLSGTFRAP